MDELQQQSAGEPLLQITDLNITFTTLNGPVHAVNGIGFSLAENESLGIVGESGSGKSVTSLAVLGLLPSRNTSVAGSIRFSGQELLTMPDRELRHIRGNNISMIFQEPMSALNPLYPVGKQIMETLVFHKKMPKAQARDAAEELLRQTGVPAPEQRLRQYPFQMSGGMCQRAMIAMALACGPQLLIADEPTTALDVTIQAQILKLMKELRRRQGMSIIMITHDLGIVADICQRVLVMYLGRIVEAAEVRQLFAEPLHPYTRGLIKALPRLGYSDEPLTAIEGAAPGPGQMPSGCPFHPRCPQAQQRCREEVPPELHLQQRMVRCWLYAEGGLSHD